MVWPSAFRYLPWCSHHCCTGAHGLAWVSAWVHDCLYVCDCVCAFVYVDEQASVGVICGGMCMSGFQCVHVCVIV